MKNWKKMVLAMVFITMYGFSALAQTTARSYYVRADGDDENNNGRSEEAPFKTLTKAVEMASKGAVKTIIVVGKIDGETKITDSGATEIIIRGKTDASEDELAVLLNGRNTILSIEGNSKIRLENIELTKSGQGLIIEGVQAIVTLG
ncbi:MAG: hypothetical protein LBN21_11215, partial [Treponema sp.]|nr:hypothetical protein [Treponema sp.]